MSTQPRRCLSTIVFIVLMLEIIGGNTLPNSATDRAGRLPPSTLTTFAPMFSGRITCSTLTTEEAMTSRGLWP